MSSPFGGRLWFGRQRLSFLLLVALLRKAEQVDTCIQKLRGGQIKLMCKGCVAFSMHFEMSVNSQIPARVYLVVAAFFKCLLFIIEFIKP